MVFLPHRAARAAATPRSAGTATSARPANRSTGGDTSGRERDSQGCSKKHGRGTSQTEPKEKSTRAKGRGMRHSCISHLVGDKRLSRCDLTGTQPPMLPWNPARPAERITFRGTWLSNSPFQWKVDVPWPNAGCGCQLRVKQEEQVGTRLHLNLYWLDVLLAILKSTVMVTSRPV